MARHVARKAQEETILRRQIEAAIGALPGVFVHRNEVGTAVQPSGARVAYGVGGPGAPDLLVEVIANITRLAVVLWIEVKTPSGVIEPHQRQWHDAARRTGRNIAVVRTVEEAVDAVYAVQGYGRILSGTRTGEAP